MTRIAAALSTATVAAFLAACGSSEATSQTSAPAIPASLATPPSVAATETPAPAEAAAATPAAAPGALSGTWSGQYTGAYSGTFTLNWTQSGSSLSGRIALSSPPQTLAINGTLRGDAISFGTVGSVAITYSGTVSGSSMSGSYQVAGSRNGSWSASKTS